MYMSRIIWEFWTVKGTAFDGSDHERGRSCRSTKDPCHRSFITCVKFCPLQYAQDAWYLRKGFSSMKLAASNDSISRDGNSSC